MPYVVLVLGCGLVAPPLIQYLANTSDIDIDVHVASRTLDKTRSVVQAMGDTRRKVTALQYDVENDTSECAELAGIVSEVRPNAIVSLLPYVYHVPAAKVALQFGVHFCTTSYVSPEMQALDKEARDKGLCFLNECGVDPGLDHMSAMRVIHAIPKGAKLRKFTSICGGLPAPSNNDNPFGYKLSWSPRGVLLASNNSALIFRDGEQVQVEGLKLFSKEHTTKEFIEGVGELEWYYNRNSVMYADIYGIPETETLIRGTYRFEGWCSTLSALKVLGFTALSEDAAYKALENAAAVEYSRHVLKIAASEDPKAVIASRLNAPLSDPILERFEWIGMFDSELKVPKVKTALDFMCWLFQRKLVYKNGEKDMIVMRHTFEIEYSPNHRVTKTSTLIDYGQQPEGYSSMARTVSLPLAVAIKHLLAGNLKATGVLRPVQPEVYNLILDEMETLGVKFVDEEHPQMLWLRAEVKKGEERVAITPENVKELISVGFKVFVERSSTRCFADSEYEKHGATLVSTNSWVNAPLSAIILGLKELPEEKPEKLQHRHVYFAHCFKYQEGWKQLLKRFMNGKGMVWDLEFLVDDKGRRVAAFGRAAGIVGSALGILTWAVKVLGESMPPLKSWSGSQALVATVKSYLDRAVAKNGGALPSVLVLGALGRCGGGASWFADQVGIKTINWDLNETQAGGPFPQLLEVDILVNSIYLSEKIPPFLTKEMLSSTSRKLSVVSDVSCDSNNPNNPLPIYSGSTDLVNPVMTLSYGTLPLHVIAIDHLPTLIPSESSREFSTALLPYLKELASSSQSPVWNRAKDLFFKKTAESLQ